MEIEFHGDITENEEGSVALLRRTFVDRDDVYAVQKKAGDRYIYVPVHEPLSDEAMRAHLEGSLTLGIYPGMTHTRWVCVDMDEREPERVRALWKKIRQHGVQPVLEDSGNKGYHFWILFETPIPLGAARAIGAFFGNGHEVFPKQDRILEGGMGSLIKLPLGVHLASGRRSQFMGEDLSPYVRQIGFLHKVERQNGARLFESLVGGRAGEGAISRTAPPQARALKPCIRELLARGTAEGQRNRVGHAIACELRRLGVDIREARGALKTWNLRNTPPLSLHELQSILQSAYNHAYEYGCAEGGFLRTIAGCDPALCLYWRSRDGHSGALDVSPADPGAGSSEIAPAP